MKNLRWLIISSVLFWSLGSRAAMPSDLETETQWKQNLLSWRADRAKGLQAPDGWLTLIGLEWLQPGDNSFGSAADNQIRIQGNAPAHLGILHLDHNAVTLKPLSGGFPGGFLVDEHAPKSEALSTEDNPSKLTYGTLSMFVIHRGDRYALRIKDSQAEARVHFHGLKWYAPNAKYRIIARWIPNNPPRLEKISTIVGTTLELPVPGTAEFTLDGQVIRLEPVIESPESKELFFIVRDATSKTTTYEASRFLYTELPSNGLDKPGTLTLDFNRLQNPPCAYTPYATCPLPPQQNRLAVAIPAGEQRYHD